MENNLVTSPLIRQFFKRVNGSQCKSCSSYVAIPSNRVSEHWRRVHFEISRQVNFQISLLGAIQKICIRHKLIFQNPPPMWHLCDKRRLTRRRRIKITFFLKLSFSFTKLMENEDFFARGAAEISEIFLNLTRFFRNFHIFFSKFAALIIKSTYNLFNLTYKIIKSSFSFTKPMKNLDYISEKE